MSMPNPQQKEMTTWLEDRTSTYDLVVVFGSYARGEAYAASDMDVLLIDSEFTGWNPENEGFFPDWPNEFQDLHVVTSSHEEFKTRYCSDEPMVTEIAEEGYSIHSTFEFLDYVKDIDCE